MRFVFILCCFSVGFYMSAQSIPIQLMVVDQNGFEMPNKLVKLRLTMREDTSSTTGQYQEVHSVTTNDLGVVSVNFGKGIVTTNSQVLAIDLFPFGIEEPYIKTELDTSISPTSYVNLGWMKYRYPMVARRAIKADTASYANQSQDSYFSDTAEYAKNFDESYDGDTSESNEIQTLAYDSQKRLLSIAQGNSIQFAFNSKEELESEVLELSSLNNASTWEVADSLFLYRFQDSVLEKAFITKPDSIITSLNVGFPIVRVFPLDSLVLGYHRSGNINIYLSDLSGNTLGTKNISTNSGYDYFNSSAVGVEEGKVSVLINRYSGNDDLYTWDSDSNTLTNNNMQGDGLNYSNRFILERNYRSYGGSGWYYRTRNRYTNEIFETEVKESSGRFFTSTDTTGKKFLLRSSYNAPLYSYTKYDSLATSGSFSIYGNAPTLYELNNGYYLVFSSLNRTGDFRGVQELYLLNMNNVGTEESTLQLVMENWSYSHPEANGSFKFINGKGEFILLFQDVNKFWINGRYRSGSFIMRFPYDNQ